MNHLEVQGERERERERHTHTHRAIKRQIKKRNRNTDREIHRHQNRWSVSWCLMSSDVSWHIRDKLWPMPKHGSINLYVHGNQKAPYDGQPRTATSTLTQLLNYAGGHRHSTVISVHPQATPSHKQWLTCCETVQGIKSPDALLPRARLFMMLALEISPSRHTCREDKWITAYISHLGKTRQTTCTSHLF